MQYQLDECPDLTGVTMEETIIANAPEPPGQQMFNDEVEENLSFNGSISKLTSSAVTVPECDITVTRGNNVFFADDSSIEILCHILQGREAHRIGGKEENSIPEFIGCVNEQANLVSGEDVRDCFHCWWFNNIEPLPILLKDILPEEHETKPIELYSAPGVVFNQPDKIVFELLCA
jgi:hypothetical protein